MPKPTNSHLKVLFLTYPRIGLNLGGLQIQIQKTAEALMAIGVEVIFYDPWKNQLPEVDICHIFSLDGTMIYHAERAAILGKPIIISPVFNSFQQQPWTTKLKVAFSKRLPGVYSDLKRANRILHLASNILALNEDEKHLLQNIFNINKNICHVIPNGIDKKFAQATPDLFIEKYELKDFILQVASIEPRKNQFNLIKAVNQLPHQLVLIGKANGANQDYLKKCQNIAGKNVHFLGQFTHGDPMLESAFAAAKLFVLPSYSEVMPLTIYEAALAGCKLATSLNVPIHPDIDKFVPRFPTDDYAKISTVINNEINKPMNPLLLDTVSKMSTWTDVGKMISDIYISTI